MILCDSGEVTSGCEILGPKTSIPLQKRMTWDKVQSELLCYKVKVKDVLIRHHSDCVSLKTWNQATWTTKLMWTLQIPSWTFSWCISGMLKTEVLYSILAKSHVLQHVGRCSALLFSLTWINGFMQHVSGKDCLWSVCSTVLSPNIFWTFREPNFSLDMGIIQDLPKSEVSFKICLEVMS